MTGHVEGTWSERRRRRRRRQRTFCILVKRFFPGTLPYILNAFWSCSLIAWQVGQSCALRMRVGSLSTRSAHRDIDFVLRVRERVSGVQRVTHGEVQLIAGLRKAESSDSAPNAKRLGKGRRRRRQKLANAG